MIPEGHEITKARVNGRAEFRGDIVNDEGRITKLEANTPRRR
jgi:hypothetical protein